MISGIVSVLYLVLLYFVHVISPCIVRIRRTVLYTLCTLFDKYN